MKSKLLIMIVFGAVALSAAVVPFVGSQTASDFRDLAVVNRLTGRLVREAPAYGLLTPDDARRGGAYFDGRMDLYFRAADKAEQIQDVHELIRYLEGQQVAAAEALQQLRDKHTTP